MVYRKHGQWNKIGFTSEKNLIEVYYIIILIKKTWKKKKKKRKNLFFPPESFFKISHPLCNIKNFMLWGKFQVGYIIKWMWYFGECIVNAVGWKEILSGCLGQCMLLAWISLGP